MAKIKPRARLIRTIGDKLISGPEAAIIELVKNSYDAESSSVNIKISPPQKFPLFGGEIVISDTGHGMTEHDLINNWLEPATDTKALNKKSRNGIRTVLGAKGVGRFASASLGHFITLESVAKVNDTYEKVVLKLDWRVFEQHKYLDEIDIDISKTELTSASTTGVTITITELTTIWDNDKVLSLIKELRRLATPTSDKFDISLDLSNYTEDNEEPYDFNGVDFLKENNQLAEILQNGKNFEDDFNHIIRPYSLLNHSDYHLKGEFDKYGNFEGTFNIVRGDNVPKPITFKGPSFKTGQRTCGHLVVDLKIYDQEPEAVKYLFKRMNVNYDLFGLRKARALIADSSGIAIYRAGFRVRPYGEPDHDWLKLEKRRVQNPSLRIGHAQVAGTIHIEDEETSHLVERSSREGLETNGSYIRLVQLLEHLFVQIEPKRKDFREKAGLSRKPKPSIGQAREIANLESISKAVQSLSPEEQKPILLKIEKESQALTKALDEIEAYQKLLESRAALGLVVGQVIHDGRTYLEPINSSAQKIIEHAKFLFEDSKKGELIREFYPTYGEAIQTGANGLSSLFQSLDPISGRSKRKNTYFPLNQAVQEVTNLLGEKIIMSGVNIQNTVADEIAYGFFGDMQAALLNIIDNAIYWLSTVKNDNPTITFSSNSDSSFVYLEIKNNGPTISEDSKDIIFDAGVSHKQDGHGLGLSIAREACRNSGGELRLSSIEPETCFTIEFPINEEK
ncbi:sensor histidine kinase [Vibrio vulnificus]|uniref:sensor histidine kinase n=1 Tax=Vibrio vulnificus TaxID=672 RepID=UPI0005076B1D|nr:sensor histidine kinase [Vibrio vulnificus]EHH1180227.1 sensor histidine kinase [Vibrio vulnificus]EHH1183186.1 sensor histidine kinase [Vibrio vulnificus]ELV8684531.1 sensor histidine kinase [Vibrio vulnificus]ELV8688894.1 sensor histidine kinase [Vibrio vulnificus]ELY1390294.1 sensor histidine kinase [Vibrio vulnificus]